MIAGNRLSVDEDPKPVGAAESVTAAADVRTPMRVLDMARRYPIAAGTLAGILAGGLVHLAGAVRVADTTFGVAAIAGALPLALRTVRELFGRKFNVDVIATAAIIGALLFHEYLAAALVVLMQSGGEALEDYGLRRANESLDNLLRRAPSVAFRRAPGESEFVSVPAGDVRVDDLILVRRGDILAADGVVVEGRGSVDESALTGEPVPLAKEIGDPVFSGTINLAGSFVVRATSPAAQSKYERIVRMVQNAQGERAPINRLANRYTPAFTLITFATAAAAWLWTHDPVRALAVLVVATPCPLIIATPLAVLSAINRAAAANIIVKSGAAVEQAGGVDTVVFDKTGTLTVGAPSLSALLFISPEGRTLAADTDPERADRLLSWIAGLEIHSSHVIGSAVVRAARDRGLSTPPAEDVHEVPGTGIAGNVAGHQITVGSGRFLSEEHVGILEAVATERSRLGATGRTLAYVAVDGDVVGLLEFEDRLRPDAADLIRRLRDLGIQRIVMLTGDAPEPARNVAAQLGIDDVRARLQPDDKLEAVRALCAAAAAASERRGGPAVPASVLMVGDGINDAPALAMASVGVAMGNYGAGIATDAADIVITVERVERVADVIAIGRRMVQVARQGIFLGIGVSLVLMAVATTGVIAPAVGALLQELLDLATILNALRARHE